MNKLGLNFPTHNVGAPSEPMSLPQTSVNPSLESARRLIVLVPEDANHTAVTRRIWELAHVFDCSILFLSLCTEAVQESALRRQLITMSAMAQDGKVIAETRVEIATSWVEAVKVNVQDDDMIVCFAEQRTGLLHRPLSQILRTNLKVPIYILSGFSPENNSRSNWLSQIIVWAGSLGILIGSSFLQIRIASLSQDWAQTILLILSVVGEIWLLWGWNSLFS